MNLNRLVQTLALTILISTGCATTDELSPIIPRGEEVVAQYIIPDRPEQIRLRDVEFHVVTEKNLSEFFQSLKKDKGEIVFVAIRISDYENLALNIAELKRYMTQQHNLILYYETVVQAKNKKDN